MTAHSAAETFEYIIVGAGSAGCVLANRLTASGRHRVLLLEAGGPDRNIWIHIPLGYGKLFSDSKVNWLYSSEPEPGLDNRKIIQPRGKVLGGSSSINGLLYIRGQHEDFDHWRQLGNAGWSFTDVLPYFRRAEDQERGADALHGAGGPLAVSNVCEPHPLCEAFLGAVEQAGLPRNDDFNGATQEGAGYFQLTARNGRRWSTAVGYLRPAQRRGNLKVVTNALASRVLLSGRRATGIEYQQGDTTHIAHVNGEVILAGGAFNSPQLLQLSGLGPADLLRSQGIDVVADMPGVGNDLQDHLQIRMQYRCTEPITMNDVINSWRHRVGAGLRYALSRKGLLAIGAGYAGGFFRTREDLATPDVQVHFIIFSADTAGAALHPFPGFIASVCQLRPESRGFVRIKSADPRQAPAIQPLSHAAARLRHRGRGPESAARNHAAAGDAALHRRGARARSELHQRCRPVGVRARGRHHRVPPDQHLPHGLRSLSRGRRAAARARHRAAARGRRLDHADRGVRQHQRGDRDDRGERRGHDLGGCGVVLALEAAARA
jgi:choline dehydrogenase